MNPDGDDWMAELARWKQDPTEAHQDELNKPLPNDDAPIHLTVFEAEKCLSIIRAYLDGLELYQDPVRDVARLLSVRALDARNTPHAAIDPWPRIDATPWPPPTGLTDRR